MGKNSKLQFGSENWLGYVILDKISISDAVTVRLRATISDFRRNGCWQLPRMLLERFPNICQDIYNYVITEDQLDKLIWENSLDGIVSCQNLYQHVHLPVRAVPWGKQIWTRFIPPRRSILLWKILHNRLTTEDDIQVRGI